MIPITRQNPMHCLAGAAPTGKVVWPNRDLMDSLLFNYLLYQLQRIYRRPRPIVLVVDSSVIYRNSITRRWLTNHLKFGLRFESVYSHSVNVIERLQKALPDAVTRIAPHRSIAGVMVSVQRFVEFRQCSFRRTLARNAARMEYIFLLVFEK